MVVVFQAVKDLLQENDSVNCFQPHVKVGFTVSV